jgi:hypothetical protein
VKWNTEPSTPLNSRVHHRVAITSNSMHNLAHIFVSKHGIYIVAFVIIIIIITIIILIIIIISAFKRLLPQIKTHCNITCEISRKFAPSDSQDISCVMILYFSLD